MAKRSPRRPTSIPARLPKMRGVLPVGNALMSFPHHRELIWPTEAEGCARADVSSYWPSVRGWGSGDDRGNDVPADGGHRVLMTRSRTEFALRQVIGDGFDERLIVGFATAQA